MERKLTRKEKIALQQKEQQGGQPGTKPAPGKKKHQQVNKERSLRRMLMLIVFVSGFVWYANSIGNKYVLDDWGLIPENTLTKKGISGLGEIFSTSYRTGMNVPDYQLYRPLSKAMFAIEWQIAPNNPAFGHTMNILCFALSCMLLFYILNVLMKGNLLVPFLTALLFASHPLHTEVVANIKSRDEILCLSFSMLTVLWTYRYALGSKTKHLIMSAFAFFLALLSKESAVTFLAVVPLVLYFFTDAARSKYIASTAALVVVTLIFLAIRRKILGDVKSPIPVVDNSLVAIKDVLLQKANAIFILGVYMKLFIWPINLCSDGSYSHFPTVGYGDLRFLLPFILFVAMAAYAIIRFRKKDPISFGLLFFFATLTIVSNVIVLIGTNYGERLMYMPSLGIFFAIAVLIERFLAPAGETVAASADQFFKKFSKPVMITTLIVILCGVRTVARNNDWHDNLTLYMTDLEKVPESAHMRFYIANHITSEDFLAALPDSASRADTTLRAIAELTKCIQIYPEYSDAYQRRAYIYYTDKKFDLSEPDYKKSLEYNNTNPVTHNNYGNLLFNTNRFAEAMEHFQMALRYNPRYAHAANNLASVYGVYGEHEKKLSQEDPPNSAAHLANSRDYFDKAINYFNKSIALDSEYPDPYHLLAITYYNIGDQANGDLFMRKYEQVKKQKEARRKES